MCGDTYMAALKQHHIQTHTQNNTNGNINKEGGVIQIKSGSVPIWQNLGTGGVGDQYELTSSTATIFLRIFLNYTWSI